MAKPLDIAGMWGAPKVAPPPPPAEPQEKPADEAIPERPPARPPRSRRKTPAPRRAEPPIRRVADTPIRREVGGTVERCYVIGTEHDRTLRDQAAITDRTIGQVAQDALDDLLDGWDEDALIGLHESPIPSSQPPAAPVRRTLTIRADQDRLLRHFRLRFGVQASDVVRQAIGRLP